MLRTAIILVVGLYVLHSEVAPAFASPPAPVPQTGQTTTYAAGDDGALKNGVAWPDPRFTDNGDGTVADNLTGLIWLKNANCFGTKNWNDALTSANTLASGACGLTDGSTVGQWRLPSVRELAGLTDISRSNPALPAGHLFASVQDEYWSGSSYVTSSGNAWYYNMNYGFVSNDIKSNYYSHGVWPVRSGAFASPPAPVPQTGQTTTYAAGDDGALQPGVAWPNPRFTDNGDGTVADRLTGLIWLKNANCFGIKIWAGALGAANGLASGQCGLTDGSSAGDWTLPNRNELCSLADFGRSNPALPAGHPFTSVQGGYWSGSSVAYVTGRAWYFVNDIGYIAAMAKDASFNVWPVRSGQYWSLDSLSLYGSLSFGSVGPDQTVPPKVITLHNSGAALQAVTGIGITGANAGEFSITPGGPVPCASLTPTLNPGERCTLSLVFAPSSAGTKAASLNIGANGATLQVPVTGSAFSTIRGGVTNHATGLPLAGATITLSTGAAVTSSGSGTFNFGPLQNGTYSISIAKDGFQTITAGNLVVTSTYSPYVDVWLPSTGFLNLPVQSALPASPGTPYFYRIRTAGGTYPYIYNLAWGTLPSGLTLDSTTGTISGTVAIGSYGNYTFAVGVTDSAQPYGAYAEVQLTINVASPLKFYKYSGGLPKSGQTSCYDITGAAMPCAGTLQDGDLRIGIPWETTRFTDNGNGTLRDTLTGLIWVKNANLVKYRDPSFDTEGVSGDGLVTWSTALSYVSKLNQEKYLGFSDWRLPNINELESFTTTDPALYFSWMNSLGFINVPLGHYWSSTTCAYSPTSAWYVQPNGSVIEYATKNNSYFYVLPVRGEGAGSIALTKTGQTAVYAAGDDGALQRGINWPLRRFTQQNDKTVLDNHTGLIWEQDVSIRPTDCTTDQTWGDSFDYLVCLNNISYLGYNDWRLPNRKELTSLIHRAKTNSADWLNTEGFINLPVDFFWSSNHSASIDGFGTYFKSGRGAYRPTVAEPTNTLPNIGSVLFVRGGGYESVSSITLPKGTVGSAYASWIPVTGGAQPYTFTLNGSLPAGLSLASNGVIKGTPSSIGNYNFTVSVTDGSGRVANCDCTIIIAPQLVISTGRFNDALINTAYSFTLSGSGGEGTLAWSITSGTLPNGLVLDFTSGTISGTATSASTQQLTIMLTDSNGRTVSKTLAFNVVDPLATTTITLPDAHVGTPYAQLIEKTGGIAPFTYTLTGQLPPGLTLTTPGVISGTPTASGFVNFGITITDGTWPTPQTVSRNFSLRTVIDVPLTVQVTGTGSGTVTSTPTQVSCSLGTCTYQVGTGYAILLHAESAVSSTFTGWTNDCTGTSDCSVLMSGAKTAVANFAIKRFPVTVSLIGDGGTVSSNVAGLTCNESVCSGTFNYGTVLTLSPVPNTGNALIGWGGACSGLGNCTVTVTDSTIISAAFSAGKVLSVTMVGNGSGTITGNPAGISCQSGTCVYCYPTDEQVILLDTASTGSLFSGYSGDCNGVICSLTMNADKNVTATFTSPLPAKIGSTFYIGVQQAYNAAAPTGSLIMLKEGVLSGPFTAESDKSITIKGGYNPTYNGVGDDSIITGGIIIKMGEVVFDAVTVR